MLTTNCWDDTSKVNEMRKVRTDRWDNTRGRSEGPERRGNKFLGEKREMTFQSLSGLICEGGAFHLREKCALRNGPGRREERRGQLREMEMEIGITPTL